VVARLNCAFRTKSGSFLHLWGTGSKYTLIQENESSPKK
jgi:hypothetical protein